MPVDGDERRLGNVVPQLLDGTRDLTQVTEDIHQQAMQTTALAANAHEETGLYIFDSRPTMTCEMEPNLTGAPIKRTRGPKQKKNYKRDDGGMTHHQRLQAQGNVGRHCDQDSRHRLHLEFDTQPSYYDQKNRHYKGPTPQ